MMRQDRLPPLPERLLAGVSGGADSVAMLGMLLERGVQVTAVHVNHGLRGADSDGDEAFVRALCALWRVPLLVYRADPPEHPGEDWARRVRYGFFREAAEKTGMRVIALAHHRDDQAETLLLHLLRGSGLTGLTAMAQETDAEGLRILRPVIGYSREELRGYLRQRGQDWREDASNADSRYLRNALRGEIIPRLEALIPGASARLAQTARLLQDEEALLEGMTQAFLRPYRGKTHLPLPQLREQPEALRRRIVRAWWQQTAGNQKQMKERCLSAAQTEALCTLIDARAGARCNLPGGWHGQTGWTHLHLLSPCQTEPLMEHKLTQSDLISIRPGDERTGDGRRTQAFPRSGLETLTVRTRRAGDWIRPFGSSGRQSLQDYLVNRHVDAPFRDQVPLVCRGSEVLLAGGVGAGNVPRADGMEDSVLLSWNTAFAWDEGS